jgi:OPT family oligopeptide transporter
VSIVFLTVIAYILGEAFAIIPRVDPITRFLNPFPFNSKEHVFIVIMASAGATSAVAQEILAAQRLYYNMTPNPGAAIFLVISSQLLGYGIAGLMRGILVQPSKMLWPINIPVNSLLETLHRDRAETWRRLKVFLAVFFFMFFYEIIPEWIFPLLQGVSIFCLAQKHSLVFTNLFGGSSGNEGLGFLSISFDWQYVASLGSPLWMPLYTLTNSLIGYLLCIVVFMALYYGNIWEAQNFPFLSQLLYDQSSNSTNFVEYNMTTVLTANHEINATAVEAQGIPYMTATYIGYLITTNMGITAALVHMFLWNYDVSSMQSPFGPLRDVMTDTMYRTSKTDGLSSTLLSSRKFSRRNSGPLGGTRKTPRRANGAFWQTLRWTRTTSRLLTISIYHVLVSIYSHFSLGS